MNDPHVRNALEQLIPALRGKNYQVTSPKTPVYNCIAWAADDDSRWWQAPAPMHIAGYYWPPGVPNEHTLENYIRAFETRGYRVCTNDPTLEEGVEKVVLYSYPGSGGCSHAARQLPNGVWVSKLGAAHDIEHSSPHDITGPDPFGYGDVVQYMSRSRAEYPLTGSKVQANKNAPIRANQ